MMSFFRAPDFNERKKPHDQSLPFLFLMCIRQKQPHVPEMQQTCSVCFHPGSRWVHGILPIGPGGPRPPVFPHLAAGPVHGGESGNSLRMKRRGVTAWGKSPLPRRRLMKC
jgi:hypothetical protein